MASYVGGSPVLEDENGNKVISFPTVTRTGYTFNKWLDTQGSELSVSSIKNDKTFYADWMANSYVVTFDPNGGSVTTTGKNVTYDSAYGELPEPMLVGYSFAGWYTASTGGTKVTSATTVATASDHTLYAHWTANQYTATFDSNGGSAVSAITKAYGSALGTLPTPTKDSYTFKGWFTSATGGTQISASTLMPLGGAKYYAHWERTVFTSSSTASVATPTYSQSNFPVLDTKATRQYYFGQYGNAFYGVTDNSTSGIWELVDTDTMMNGNVLETQPDGPPNWGVIGDKLLLYTNNVSTYFLNADKIAMKQTSVSVDTYDEGETVVPDHTLAFLDGAYMWPLTSSQLNSNRYLEEKLYGNISKRYQEDSTWYHVRTYHDYTAATTQPVSGHTYICMDGSYGYLCVHRVHPAFNLDLSKVLIPKVATSGTGKITFSAWSTPNASTDLKFLINAGTTKSSFNVPSVNNKVLDNVTCGTTYYFDYTGASTSTLNSGKNYVSAIIYDSNGVVKYYGNLAEITSESGTASIMIPSNLSAGTYKLALFEEEKCDAYKTDYASLPVIAQFTIR